MADYNSIHQALIAWGRWRQRGLRWRLGHAAFNWVKKDEVSDAIPEIFETIDNAILGFTSEMRAVVLSMYAFKTYSQEKRLLRANTYIREAAGKFIDRHRYGALLDEGRRRLAEVTGIPLL